MNELWALPFEMAEQVLSDLASAKSNPQALVEGFPERKARGYELPARHFAHRIEADEIEETDLFLPMTASHMRALKRQLPADKQAEVHMYRSFDPDLKQPAAGREDEIDLVDPWYGGSHEFEVAIDQIEHVAPYIVDWVERQLA